MGTSPTFLHGSVIPREDVIVAEEDEDEEKDVDGGEGGGERPKIFDC